MTFPQRLRQARAAVSKTQRFVAEAMGVSVQAVSQWENGQSTIQSERIERLAEVLGVPSDWLEKGDEDKAPELTPFNQLKNKIYSGNQPCPVIPLTNLHKALSAGVSKSKEVVKKIMEDMTEETVFVQNYSIISPVAIKIESNQLDPDLQIGDIAIFDMGTASRPGDIVVVFLSMDGYFQVSQLSEQAPHLIPAIIKFDPKDLKTPNGIMVSDIRVAIKEGNPPAIIMLGPLVERRTFPRRSRLIA